ncbi:MAG TPA: hypothetical protein VM686_18645 [Polyangiaceae bacterium]|nr:hypothetical protein [Polyangiaceae bacterium]
MRQTISYATLVFLALSGCQGNEDNDGELPSAVAGQSSGGGAGDPGAAGQGGTGAGAGSASAGTTQGGTAATAGGEGGQGDPSGGTGPVVVNLPEGKGWLELAGTELSSVCACNDGFPEVCANSGCGGIFSWSSGAYDSLRERLIVFGGGHSDYFGNELYALSLSDLTMTRLTDPGLPLAPDCAPSTAEGTQPSSRHTYDTLLYVEHADRLFVFGGSMPPCGYLSQDTWTYSFADQVWEPHEPSGPIPNAVPGIAGDYDPISQKIFLHDDAALYSYDLEQDAFELLLENDAIDYHLSGVIDPVSRKLVLVGAGSVYTYDLDGDHTRVTLATTGGDSIVGSSYPGLAYDADNARIVAWNGGDSAFSLELESGEWTALTSPNGPGAANETGTYKRWRYVPGQSSFVLVNGPNQNGYLFRL